MMNFEKNVLLDANLLLRGMRGGMDYIMEYAFLNRQIFPNAEMVVNRCLWFKELDDEEYINVVIKKVIELENK